MEDLFANEDVLGLVDGIARVGYLSHDVPVVIEREGRYVMVEGNRRLAALKAIQNPQLVPDFRARISALTKQITDRSALARVRVMVAPDQEQADQLVAAIHTGNLRRRWSPSRQAAFFQAQIDSGRTLKTLVARYPTIEVRRFVFRAKILNEFKAVKFGDPALVDYVQTKAWNRGLSTLARVYESKDFLELTGFSMDENGSLKRSISAKVFREMATVIVRGMLDGELNTRSMNTVKSPRFLQLMGDLREIAGQPRGGVAAEEEGGAAGEVSHQETDASATASDARSSADTVAPRRRQAPKKEKQRYLDLGQIPVPDAYPIGLKSHFAELSAIEVQHFPNATFLLMRAVLEKSIKAFAEIRGEDIKGSGNNTKGRVQLGHALKWLLEYVTAQGATDMIQPINRVRAGKLNYMATSDSLNAVNHNHKFFVDSDEAIGLWQSIEPIMRYVIKP